MATKSTRGTLNRDRILRAALSVVDADGAEALTMRRIATDLGVDPMALYRHVPNKDALLDGVVEMVWDEVSTPPRRHDQWAEPLRSYAHNLRAAINAHPRAVPLLLTRRVFARPSLQAGATLLANLRDAGFEEAHAAQILRSVISAALGEALSTMTYQALSRSAPPAAEPDTWISITQALPADTPPEQVRAAHAICTCEPDADFTFILDLILSGAQGLKRPAR